MVASNASQTIEDAQEYIRLKTVLKTAITTYPSDVDRMVELVASEKDPAKLVIALDEGQLQLLVSAGLVLLGRLFRELAAEQKKEDAT